jgi:hypothetical protein
MEQSMVKIMHTLAAATMAAVASLSIATDAHATARSVSTTTVYRTVTVDGLKIFYREAGPKDAPTILLLHGYPSSSRMFATLIPLLADRYHLIAPDYPGFGQSDAPPASQFEYTFDHLAGIIDQFTQQIGLKNYVLYQQDYGGPIGMRLAVAHPDRLRASSCKMQSRMKMALGRPGTSAAHSGKTVLLTRKRSFPVSLQRKGRKFGTSALRPIRSVMIPNFGRSKARSWRGPANARFSPTCSSATRRTLSVTLRGRPG